MKIFTLFIASFCSFGISFGQLFSENFESYAVGSYLGPNRLLGPHGVELKEIQKMLQLQIIMRIQRLIQFTSHQLLQLAVLKM